MLKAENLGNLAATVSVLPECRAEHLDARRNAEDVLVEYREGPQDNAGHRIKSEVCPFGGAGSAPASVFPEVHATWDCARMHTESWGEGAHVRSRCAL